MMEIGLHTCISYLYVCVRAICVVHVESDDLTRSSLSSSDAAARVRSSLFKRVMSAARKLVSARSGGKVAHHAFSHSTDSYSRGMQAP